MSRSPGREPMCPPTAGGQSCVEEGAMTDIGNSQPAIQVLEAEPDKKDLDKKNDRVTEFEVRAKSRCASCNIFSTPIRRAVPAIVLLLGIAAFGSIVGSRFLSSFNLSLIIQQVTIIGVIGAAQTLIVITAGIDLSVGAIMVLCSVIMGKLAVTGRPARPARAPDRHRGRRRAAAR